MSEKLPQDMPERVPEEMPERMSDKLPKDMPDRMPEDITERQEICKDCPTKVRRFARKKLRGYVGKNVRTFAKIVRQNFRRFAGKEICQEKCQTERQEIYVRQNVLCMF